MVPDTDSDEGVAVSLSRFICGGLARVTRALSGFGGGFFIVPLLYALLTTTQGAGGELAHAAMHVAVATSTCVMIFYRADGHAAPAPRQAAGLAPGATATGLHWLGRGARRRCSHVAQRRVSVLRLCRLSGRGHCGPCATRRLSRTVLRCDPSHVRPRRCRHRGGIGMIAAFLGVLS